MSLTKKQVEDCKPGEEVWHDGIGARRSPVPDEVLADPTIEAKSHKKRTVVTYLVKYVLRDQTKRRLFTIGKASSALTHTDAVEKAEKVRQDAREGIAPEVKRGAMKPKAAPVVEAITLATSD